ncbi:MAG: GNAT family N-acetyltransferase [Cyanobacteria bacterium P01_F01_bin.4]
MALEILKATQEDKPILRRMLELHQHDLSSFSNADLNQHGEFGYPYLDHYWTEPERHSYLARLSGKLAGFALVNTHHYLPESDYSMAEFFVMKRYRRQGLGRAMAMHIFEQHPGIWEIRQLPGHTEAVTFWKNTIRDRTPEIFKEILGGYGDWPGPILQFNYSENQFR